MDLAIGEECLRKWLDYMRKEGLLEVAELILMGHSSPEIAGKLGMTKSQARRKLGLVHKLTQDAFPEESAEE